MKRTIKESTLRTLIRKELKKQLNESVHDFWDLRQEIYDLGIRDEDLISILLEKIGDKESERILNEIILERREENSKYD